MAQVRAEAKRKGIPTTDAAGRQLSDFELQLEITDTPEARQLKKQLKTMNPQQRAQALRMLENQAAEAQRTGVTPPPMSPAGHAPAGVGPPDHQAPAGLVVEEAAQAVIEEHVDHFAGALESVEQLRELYEPPGDSAVNKEIQEIDETCRRLIAASPMVFVATSDTHGRCDVTPRGGAPGFVTVLDDHHLALPDATGNRRIDTLQNVVANGHAGPDLRDSGTDTDAAGQRPRLRHLGRGAAAAADAGGKAAADGDRGARRRGLHPLPEGLRPVEAVAARDLARPRRVSHGPGGGVRPRPAARSPALTLAEVEKRQEESFRYRLL